MWYAEVPSTRRKPNGQWEILTKAGASKLMSDITTFASQSAGHKGFSLPQVPTCALGGGYVEGTMGSLLSAYGSKFSELDSEYFVDHDPSSGPMSAASYRTDVNGLSPSKLELVFKSAPAEK